MSIATLAPHASEHIKIMASLIADHGWCGSNADPIAHDGPAGLTMTRAAIWAVGGEGCLPRDLTEAQNDRVLQVIAHLEGPLGLGMSFHDYEREFAGASAQNVSWEILIAAVRVHTYEPAAHV